MKRSFRGILVIAALAMAATWSTTGRASSGALSFISQPPNLSQLSIAPAVGSSPEVLCGPSGCGGGGGGSTCSTSNTDQQYNHVGYDHAPSIIPIGSTGHVYISDDYDYLNNSGHVAGWIGVTQYNGNSPVAWLQAGLGHSYGGSLDFYIEYNSGTGAQIDGDAILLGFPSGLSDALVFRSSQQQPLLAQWGHEHRLYGCRTLTLDSPR